MGDEDVKEERNRFHRLYNIPPHKITTKDRFK